MRVVSKGSALTKIDPEEKLSNWVMLAFWLLVCSEIVLATQEQTGGGWTKAQQLIPSLFMLGAFVLLVRASHRRLRVSRVLHEMPRWVPVMWFLLLGWGLVTIFRSFKPDIIEIYYLFGKPGNAMPWLIPIFMILGSSALVWKKLTSLFYVHALLAIPVLFYTYLVLGRIAHANLFYAVPILLILQPFFAPKKRKKHLLLTAIYILFALAIGSRTSVMQILYYIAVWYFIGFFGMKRGGRFIFGLTGSVVVGVLIVSLVILYKGADISFLPERVQANVAEFQEREFKNTRKYLYGELWTALDEDDRLIGRGALGGYYSRIYHGIHLKRDEVTKPGWRTAIECGYMHVLLKGGFVMIALMLALAVPAAILGIFWSKNLFSRLCGFIVFEWLVTMYPYGLPEVRFQYILFWMCVGACLSPSLRARKNDDFDFSPVRVLPRLRY